MLSNKIFLLTGASGGIGSALLEYFVEKMQYLITANRKKLEDFLNLKPIPSNLEHLPMDLTIEDNVKKLFQHITEKYGRLNILINCAGGSLFSHPIEDFPSDEFDKIIALNLKTPFLLTKHAIKLMKTQETGGNMVFYVSSSAKNISHNKAPYGSAKAGLAHFIHYVASEVGSYNIRVNGISPTYVFTPRHEKEIQNRMQKTGDPRAEILKRILSRQLIKKPMQSKDLIEVTELLATTQSITGQIYNCSMGEVLSY